MSPDETPPKIIIDEDWKQQAQAEKEALSKAAPDGGKEPAAPAPAAKQKQPPAREPLPPVTFPGLLSMLASQAMISLGQIANPITGQAEVDLSYAKHFIDTLQLLEEKTRNNLTADEAGMLDGLLHELRLGYVTMQNRAKAKCRQG